MKQAKRQSFGLISTTNGDRSALQNFAGERADSWLRWSYSYSVEAHLMQEDPAPQIFSMPTHRGRCIFGYLLLQG